VKNELTSAVATIFTQPTWLGPLDVGQRIKNILVFVIDFRNEHCIRAASLQGTQWSYLAAIKINES
jgi:hypothetical protein